MLDLNQDGALMLDEFRQQPIPEGTHEEVFQAIDANGDGVVTQAEYEGFRPSGGPPPR